MTTPDERRKAWNWPHPIKDRQAQKAKIARRLRAARREAKLSTDEVAAWLGTYRERIKEYESGRASVPVEELYAFAWAYGEDIEFLAGIG